MCFILFSVMIWLIDKRTSYEEHANNHKYKIRWFWIWMKKKYRSKSVYLTAPRHLIWLQKCSLHINYISNEINKILKTGIDICKCTKYKRMFNVLCISSRSFKVTIDHSIHFVLTYHVPGSVLHVRLDYNSFRHSFQMPLNLSRNAN